MSPLKICLLTSLSVGLVWLVWWAIFTAQESLLRIVMDSRRDVILRLLVIPLWAVFAILQLFLLILAGLAGIALLNDFRNWWHRK